MHKRRLTGIFLAFLVYALPCPARAVKVWSFDEMRKAADLVVIARPIQSEKTAAKLNGYDMATGTNTTFEVLAALKGSVDGTLVVRHFVFPYGGLNLVNAPGPVSFPTGDQAATYLLFLSKNKDGTYAPVSGQIDPCISCFILSNTPPAGLAAADANTQTDKQLTKRISDILEECQNIKPGTTRAELLKTFMTEGGISTAEHQTFVLRRCPFIKIDVDFTLSVRTPNAHQDPADTISKVSRLYLAWSIAD